MGSSKTGWQRRHGKKSKTQGNTGKKKINEADSGNAIRMFYKAPCLIAWGFFLHQKTGKKPERKPERMKFF